MLERETIGGPKVEAQCGLPVGPYSQGVAIRGGRTLYIAGQQARGPEGKVLFLHDAPAQYRRAMENIRAIIEAAGGRLEHLVKVVNYYAESVDHDLEYPKIAAIRRELLPGGVYPVSTAVIVKWLMDGALVEVDAIAVIPD